VEAVRLQRPAERRPEVLKTKVQARYDAKARVEPVGVVEVHLGHTATFFTLATFGDAGAV